MGRKKQVRPHRSIGMIDDSNSSAKSATKEVDHDILLDPGVPFFVEVDRSYWVSNQHYDISEVILNNVTVMSQEFYGFVFSEDFYRDAKYLFRFRLPNVNEYIGRMKLGHWPVLCAGSIYLEVIERRVVEGTESDVVLLAGGFDGPDEGVSGLVHLVNMKFFTLRPVLGVTLSESCPSLRVRVEILKKTFDACGSLFDNTRELWRKKSMMNLMAWLRPEVITSDARYGYNGPEDRETDLRMEIDGTPSGLRKRARFNAAGLYEAIKPSKEALMLEDELPELLPELRPYQRRAVYWMIQREKGVSGFQGGKEREQFVYPLCMPINLIDTSARVFYNSFSGNISLHPEFDRPHVFGGILADEMGLGKTVEVLACIFAHRGSASQVDHLSDDGIQVSSDHKYNIKRMKRERVECVCGDVSESSKYEGLWVQCDTCDAWQHADCVGYSVRDEMLEKSKMNSKEQGSGKNLTGSLRKMKRRKISTQIVVTKGAHICQMCSELIKASDSPVATGATLIVCPAPILPQWHSEIVRHTKSGSLKTCIYDGVRNTSTSNTSVMDIDQLLDADIVLTTYDVLKDDLSHDSDRYEGDRRFMRFRKRYPVVPTLLTRISWWRICLDEAQMVESNVAAATEMAMRLHATHRWCITGTPIQRKLDDLFGLLRFLRAGPYDVLRWWTEVIRDPYENGDAGAMVFTHKFFKQIMWRSSKVHVAEELLIPPQEESVSWISLSPIEEHFYQRQYETCVDYAREIIASFKDVLKRKVSGTMSSDSPSDNFFTHAEAGKLLNSLLKLRQACCHPQVGSSGLRSLQQSPMTMDEILLVLVGKTKVEGEEALRKLVVALNAIAAIAIIRKDFSLATSLYKEALTSAEEHSEDFRLDPLLNIHTLHNLAEMVPLTSDLLHQFQFDGQFSGSSVCKFHKMSEENGYEHDVKKLKVSRVDVTELPACRYTSDQCLRLACDNLKLKFLSLFNSKLSVAQEDFRKSYLQVCNIFNDRKSQNTTWWLDTLNHIEQHKDSSSELIRKIEEAVSGTLNTSRMTGISSCFRSITTLKYYLQTTLDSLEDSRNALLHRLLEIDKRMGNPREEDIQRVRYCPNCYSGDGLICVHCELDELFKVYEARLFRLNKSNDGGLITSAEEAVDLQKKKSALNQFYWKLSQADKNLSSSSVGNDDHKKRDVGEKVMVSKSPSEVEVILGIMKNYSRTLLGREVMSSATKHLLLLEGMRKEYAQARSLAIAQAQVLRAHDEIKMATSRLRLREDENDKSIDALALGELDAANVAYSGEKLIASSELSRIRGQLRYLKGLVQSTQMSKNSSITEDKVTSPDMQNECVTEHGEETCPVCQEKLTNRKMVFQCGHVTCCKCLFAMSERRKIHHAGFQSEWVLCPTCRRHTDFGNIAYVDDEQDKSCDASFLHAENSCEASVTVKGSYSTKIEAVTKRILWINSTNPEARVLVFSSWNDVLDVLQHAFAANNINFVRMKGGRKSHVAISRFRGEKSHVEGGICDGHPVTKPVQVLLILIQHGANGLNLLEAQHVILVEPLLNPAAEAQAISRVHRIGQKNKTLVHRFLVKDTVEESIYKMNRSRSTFSYISGNKKNQDQPILTLEDLESLFRVAFSSEAEAIENPTGSLMHLPPSVAAAISAERRLMEQRQLDA